MPKKKTKLQEPSRDLKELKKKKEIGIEEPDKSLKEPATKQNSRFTDEEVVKNGEADEPTKNALEATIEKEQRADSMGMVNMGRELKRLAVEARRKYDRDWLSRNLFWRGYQFVNQNPKTGTIAMTSLARARVPVNLTWAYVRSIKNQATSFQPKWDVLPEFKGKKAEQDARLSGKLLDYVFKINNMRKFISEAVVQGLLFSVGGPFEVYWDPMWDNGPNQPKGNVRIILHDPFDVYVDPDCTSLGDAEFLIKAVRTPVESIRANKDFDEDVRSRIILGTSPKKAESEYKQFLLQTIQSGFHSNKENDHVILYELQKRERDGDDMRIRYLTWVDEMEEPLMNKLIDREDFDLETFHADTNPLEYYGESWGRQVIALNRVLNSLESSVFEYNYKYAKGRLVIDKNSGVRTVSNEHGSIIEKNRGAEVKPLPLAPLPVTVENQIIRLKAMMEDISGVHEATLGRTPPGIKSGIGVAELKQSDATNQDDLVQSLENCLVRLGKKILRVIAEHYDTPRVIKVVGTGRIVEHFAAVGETYIDEEKDEWTINKEKYPLAHIAKSNELEVQIGSWLAYSKEARQKTLMDMAKAELIDQETVLKHMEFPDIQDIVDGTRAQALIEQKRKEDPAMPSGVNQELLAMSENEMLDEGSPMPVDPELDDHDLHIAIHSRGMNGENTPVRGGHIAEHRRSQQGGGQLLSTPKATPAGQQVAPAPPPLPPMAPGQVPMPPTPPDQVRPPESYFSAGIQELPPTAGAVLGAPISPLPIPTF